MPGGGRSIAYTFTLRITTRKTIAFDSVWVAGRRLPLTQDKEAASGINAYRIITLRASQYTSGSVMVGKTVEEKEDEGAQYAAKAPVKYLGAALLSYRVDGKELYFDVPKISPLPTLYGQ